MKKTKQRVPKKGLLGMARHEALVELEERVAELEREQVHTLAIRDAVDEYNLAVLAAREADQRVRVAADAMRMIGMRDKARRNPNMAAPKSPTTAQIARNTSAEKFLWVSDARNTTTGTG